MRLAFYSPLPPMRSGIADYSAELLPALAAHCDIELIVDDGFRPDSGVAGGFPVHGKRALPELLARGRFDAVLYQLGNNRDYHAGIYSALLDHPGVVVLHEAVLHHLVRDLTLYAGDPEAYVRELRYAYGRTGEAMARRCVATGVPLDPWSYPLFERAVDASRGLIVHNRFTRDRVLASRPLARVAVVPHHLSLGALPEESPAAARAALGLAPETFAVATFGFLTAAKRPGVLLRAFARLRRELPQARLLIAGEVSPHFDFDRVLAPELREGVTVTGRLGLDRFLLYMQACDVAVNLRHPTAGETSGTVIRLLGLGKPLIVNDTGAFAEIPDDCCAKVGVDEAEEELLFAYLRRLVADEPLRRRMGENARRHAAADHSLAGSARGYAELLREVVETGARPFRAVPPLAPYPEEDLLSDLVRDVTADLTDLGAEEGDEDPLREIAAAVVELDLDRP
ncbi:MAG TPA: glycosyltransferase family 4 protein [Thermoanaerobaculia bacterium]|jgi:glycosyltransferase involved in cell wall biosynthesis|nr:glycosyltransferase family 4 protein [Thermoanaerobaculia bacterium]